MNVTQLQEENQKLAGELRKTKRELNSALFQIERYKASVQGKENMSRIISAEKARRDLFLTNLLRVTPEIVLLMNDELNVVMCSASYLEAASMQSYDEIIGTPGIPDRLDYPEGKDTQTVRQELFETMWNKEFLAEEIYFTFVPGTEKRYYRKYTLPICDKYGDPVGVILLFNDATDLIAARKNAENASEAKSSFLANMSHEIRTPMNAVIGMTSIAKGSDDIEQKDYCLGKIHSASLHLLGVINDILDMSKIEANKLAVSLEEFDFEKMLMKVSTVISYNVEQKNQTLNIQIGDGIPQYLVSDDQRLSQVITNLLSNAVKFTPDSGVITLRANKVSEDDGVCTLRIKVQDTGIGISEEQQSRLFHSFEQADASTSRKFGGTGLGLAISKRIVQMLGGDIWVESEEDKGSRFIFTIRAKRGRADDRAASAPNLDWERLRILAVDDSKDVREYFGNLANTLHFHCDTACDGFEAQNLLLAEGVHYDVVFVDMRMPNMDGLELTRFIKGSGINHPVVIMISAMAWSDIEEDAKQAGVDRFISKPLFPSAIIDAINQSCGYMDNTKAPATENKTYDFSKNRILLAEDVEINREILITLLEPTGIAIDCAENGEQAVDMFRDAPSLYDMVFMDIHMPKMDGYEATGRIRRLDIPRAQSVPIVAMTANVFREDVEKCLNAGMDDHVGKPLDIGEVEEKLEKYLERPGKPS